MLSVIIPTYNERENIEELVRAVSATLRTLEPRGLAGEILVVDDDSPDGTAGAVRRLELTPPARVIVRRGERGLSGAVMEGFRQARGDILAVMDADLTHRPEDLVPMLDAIEQGARLVTGSRFVPGAEVAERSLVRRLYTGGAQWLAAGLTRSRDPMSGFLMLRREVLEGAELAPRGYKIGLELLVKGRHGGRVREVPIRFQDRVHGSSKLGGSVILHYLRHLFDLYVYSWTRSSRGGKR